MKDSVGVGVKTLRVAKMRYSPASNLRSESFIIRYQILYHKNQILMIKLRPPECVYRCTLLRPSPGVAYSVVTQVDATNPRINQNAIPLSIK